MQELFISSIVLSFFFLLTSCNTNSHQNIDLAAKQVCETVKARNKAGAELEDINEQLKFVHDEIIFITPSFKEINKGKEKY